MPYGNLSRFDFPFVLLYSKVALRSAWQVLMYIYIIIEKISQPGMCGTSPTRRCICFRATTAKHSHPRHDSDYSYVLRQAREELKFIPNPLVAAPLTQTQVSLP